MPLGGTGRFVLVDRIPEWKTDFSVASQDAGKRTQEQGSLHSLLGGSHGVDHVCRECSF